MTLISLPLRSILRIFGATCPNDINLLGIQGWYKYMPRDCSDGSIKFADYNIGSVWLILAGIVDILLRIATLVSVGYFIWGAFKMITSQGSPEGVKNARTTMTNAVVGLIVSVVCAQVLTFIMRHVIGIGV